jgi:O-antigen ligase
MAFVIWPLIPTPRDFNLLRLIIFLSPIQVMIPIWALARFPGLRGLNFWGQIILLFVLFSIFISAKDRAKIKEIIPIAFGFFLFLGGGIVAILFPSQERLENQLWWDRVCLLSAVSFFASYMYIRTIDQAERLYNAISYSMASFSLFILMFASRMPLYDEFSRQGSEWQGRLMGVAQLPLPDPFGLGIKALATNNPPQLGEFLSIGLVALFPFAIHTIKTKLWLLKLFLLGLMLVVIVSTQARGAIVATIISCVFIIILHQVKFKSTRALRRIMIFFVIGLGIAFALTQYRMSLDPTGRIFSERILEMRNPFYAETFIARVALWDESIKGIAQHPFGMGFAEPFSLEGRTNPHNLFLWILQGGGFIGLAGFIIALVAIVTKLIKGLSFSDERRVLLSMSSLGVLVTVLTEGLGSVVFAQQPTTIAFWVLLGSSLAALRCDRFNMKSNIL